ncbi:hypothetical protein Goklo_004640 [Gossypium klotzschianum]|uniref:Uncharacterized protein n=1 Tax=Gossypium klotzschianum TaxID=34286 RepID=A0A7J8VQE7_9ROSI|nr:hypothetical protein [Gossypium klotzschianum]
MLWSLCIGIDCGNCISRKARTTNAEQKQLLSH